MNEIIIVENEIKSSNKRLVDNTDDDEDETANASISENDDGDSAQPNRNNNSLSNKSLNLLSSSNRRKQLKPNRIQLIKQQQQQKLNVYNERKRKLLNNNDEDANENADNKKRDEIAIGNHNLIDGEDKDDDDEVDSSNFQALRQLNKRTQSSSLLLEPGATTTQDAETAYCNICKKGFCNKYFLKSHIANRHAGSFEPTSTVYLGSTGSMITHFKYASPRKQSSQHQPHEFTQEKFKINQNTSGSPNGMTESVASPVNKEIDSGTLQQEANTLQSLMTEDYCDSCQKHFCNKYYLRKHKLDVHGIVIDNNIKPYKKHDKSSRSMSKNSEGKLMDNSSSPTLVKSSSQFNDFNTNENTSQSFTDELQPPPRRNHRRASNCNDLKPPPLRSSTPQPLIQQQQHQNNGSHSQLSETPSPSPILTHTPPQSLLDSQTLPSPFNIPNHLMLVNPYIMQLPHLLAAKHAAAVAAAAAVGSQVDLLSPLGLQNPPKGVQNANPPNFDLFLAKMQTQATSPLSPPASMILQNPQVETAKKEDEYVNCNLCSKSFCNFDFLKLHLINKHGISDQPLQSKLKNEPNEIRYELKLHDSNANTNTFCFLCEKDFSSKQLLKQHIMQKHNLVPGEGHKIKNLMENVDTKASIEDQQVQFKSLTEDLLNGTPGGKCLDKVVCNICNKQLCNKYFLRTHKAKVHGIKYDLVNGLSMLSGNGNATSPTSSMSSNGGYGQVDGSSSEFIDINSRKRRHDEDEDDDATLPMEEQLDMGTMATAEDDLCEQDEDEKENKLMKNSKMKQTELPINDNNNNSAALPVSYLKAYCEICNKELCNKYFLKAHMQNAHNINIDDESDTVVSATATTETTKAAGKKQKQKNHMLLNDSYRDSEEQQQQQAAAAAEFAMQPFLIESKDKRFMDNFVPCLVYLPVKNRIQTTIQLQLQLKPLDQNHLASALASTNSNFPFSDTQQSPSNSNTDDSSALVIDMNNEQNSNNNQDLTTTKTTIKI